jgi:cytochrome c553
MYTLSRRRWPQLGNEHQVMNAVTKSLSDEDIADLAEHYASLPGGPTQ